MDRLPAITEPAAVHYEVHVIEPGRWSRSWRSVALLAVGLVTSGAGPTNPGGRRARIIERSSGRTLRTVSEHLGDSPGGDPLDAAADVERLDRDEFRRRWL